MKKALFLCLMAVLAITLFAGCNRGDGNGGGTAVTPAVTPAPAPPPPATPAVPDVPVASPDSWLVPEHTTINLAASLAAGWAHPTEGSFFEWLEEYTNIAINWTTHLNTEWTELFPLMMASRDLPDAFFGSGPWSGTAQILLYGVELGVYRPLNQLINDYAPNFRRRGEEAMPGLMGILTAPDGNIYAMPTIHPFTDARVWNAPAINQTWLDNLGLDMPTTIDEMEAVLIAFRDGDPNNDGQPIVPFSFLFGCWGAADMTPWFAPFGQPLSPDFIMIENNQVLFQPTQPFFRDGARWLASLYAQNLIDLEVFTHDQTSYRARAGAGPNPTFGIWTSWNPIEDGGAMGHHYTLMPPIYGPGGASVLWNQVIAFTRDTFIITDQASDPGLLMRWVDVFYRDIYMGLRATQGPGPGENLAWFVNDAGQIARVEPLPPEMIRGQNEHPFAPGIIGPEYVERMAPRRYPDLKLEQIDDLLVHYATNFLDGTWNRWPGPAFMEAHESDEITFIEADMMPFVRQTLARWIAGEGDVDAEWDAFQADLNAFGLQRWLTIRQNVWNRVQAG